MPLRLAFFASNNGTSMRNIVDAIDAGMIDAQPVLLIANKPQSGAIDFAKAHGIPVRYISRKTHPDDAARDDAILAALQDVRAELIVLSGYLQKVGPKVISAYTPRLINIHPALLPDFGGEGMYGRHVHEAVLAARRTESGASIHIVDAAYDRGPVIAQRRVPVVKDDTVETLAARVEAAEKELMIETVRAIASGRLDLSKFQGGGA